MQQAIAGALQARDSGVALPAGDRLTVAIYLEQWLEGSARNTLRPRTWHGYRLIADRHLLPALGRVPLAKLTAAQVQALINAKVAAGAAPQTVRNIHAVLRRALEQAVRWSMLQRNVARLVSLPRAESHDVPALSGDDARAVLEAVGGDRIEPLVTVTLATGLRQGEALGLQWGDVDLEADTLTVRHALQRFDGRVDLVEPKTRRSRRTVQLPAFAVAALRRQREWVQEHDRRLAGSRWREGGYVFTSTIGTPLTGSDVTRRFQQLLARAGLPRMRFHDLRHGTASLLIAQGVQPRVVMETLGHSTIATTMNIYAHVVPALQREAADRLDTLLG